MVKISEAYAIEKLGLRVADHVSAMLAYWDKDLVCRFANASYLEWFGKKKEDMIGKITIKELLGPLYEKNLPYIKGALEGKRQTFEREIPVPGGVGTRHSLANYFPDIVHGEVQGFFVHVADVTQIKLLEAKVNLRNQTLMSFANIVSHNLRSYSTNLASIIDFLENSKTEDEKEQMMGYLKSISKTFSETVNNLNELVSIQNTSELKYEAISFHEYIRKVIDILRTQIESNHVLIVDRSPCDGIVNLNAAYFESIVLNLLSNAIKYRNPARVPVIEIDATVSPGRFVLTVRDNGKGIDLVKYGDKIFGLFKTFHGNSDAKGLGLYITKYQVESMNGQIQVESQPDMGTTFTITFKLDQPVL